MQFWVLFKAAWHHLNVASCVTSTYWQGSVRDTWAQCYWDNTKHFNIQPSFYACWGKNPSTLCIPAQISHQHKGLTKKPADVCESLSFNFQWLLIMSCTIAPKRRRFVVVFFLNSFSKHICLLSSSQANY